MELFKANKQWATRPPDERFPSLQALYDVTKNYAAEAREKDVPYDHLRVEAVDGDVHLVGKTGIPAKLTHWAFGQLAARIGAPADYLRDLPATLASQNLNHGLANRVKEYGNESIASLLFHNNGGLLLRAITSEKYSRFWNHEVAKRLLDLQADGWEPAVPDWGEQLTALYASDHDMFAFIRFKNNPIKEAGTTEPIYRGAIVWNSEVGAQSLGGMLFGYRAMCQNHIIWGAQDVTDFSVRHVGNSLHGKFSAFAAQLRKYANSSASDEEAKIVKLQHTLIGSTKEEVLDNLFGKRSFNLSRKVLNASYDAVKPEQDGDPNTVWGFAQGITRFSQTTPFADERTRLDKAAGKILQANF